MDNKVLPIYCVYDHPSDYPEHFVIKRDLLVGLGQIVRDPEYLFLATEYNFVRYEMLKRGLVRLDRSKDDDPVILETWL